MRATIRAYLESPAVTTDVIYRDLTSEERAQARQARLSVKSHIERALERDLARRARESGVEKVQAPLRYPQFVEQFDLGGVYLHNIFFWDTKGANCDGWFWKDKGTISTETGLSIPQQDKWRRRLEDVRVMQSKRGQGNKLYYRIDFVGIIRTFNLKFSSHSRGEDRISHQGSELEATPGVRTGSHTRGEVSYSGNASGSSSVTAAGPGGQDLLDDITARCLSLLQRIEGITKDDEQLARLIGKLRAEYPNADPLQVCQEYENTHLATEEKTTNHGSRLRAFFERANTHMKNGKGTVERARVSGGKGTGPENPYDLDSYFEWKDRGRRKVSA